MLTSFLWIINKLPIITLNIVIIQAKLVCLDKVFKPIVTRC